MTDRLHWERLSQIAQSLGMPEANFFEPALAKLPNAIDPPPPLRSADVDDLAKLFEAAPTALSSRIIAALRR